MVRATITISTAFPEQENSEQQLYQWIADWLGEVLHTPLNQGFQLKQLAAGQYLSECPFYLALSDRVLAMQRVQQLFEEYGIEMPELLEAKSARYLNGSIDLVYFDGQRYHIADYKSNYLGQSNWIISSLRLQKVCRCRVIGYKQRYIWWHYIVICR
jgi:ATP-dependent exoDNAse (exonuclease V) beta subunit